MLKQLQELKQKYSKQLSNAVGQNKVSKDNAANFAQNCQDKTFAQLLKMYQLSCGQKVTSNQTINENEIALYWQSNPQLFKVSDFRSEVASFFTELGFEQPQGAGQF